MRKLSDLKISPVPWKYIQESGYDRESGDFNSSDIVYDAEGEVLSDFWNGETYGEVYPHAEADARFIAASPKLYDRAQKLVSAFDKREMTAEHIEALRSALAEAAGEEENK